MQAAGDGQEQGVSDGSESVERKQIFVSVLSAVQTSTARDDTESTGLPAETACQVLRSSVMLVFVFSADM